MGIFSAWIGPLDLLLGAALQWVFKFVDFIFSGWLAGVLPIPDHPSPQTPKMPTPLILPDLALPLLLLFLVDFFPLSGCPELSDLIGGLFP